MIEQASMRLTMISDRDEQGQESQTKVAGSSGGRASICARCSRTLLFQLAATTCLLAALTLNLGKPAEGASANRVNMHIVSPQMNHYFLNEFCDLESKTMRPAKRLKQANDTHSLFLTNKNSHSSVRVMPQKQLPSTIAFGFGSPAQVNQPSALATLKQLNCSIIVVAPKSHGLLVTVNSIVLPKNLVKLGIILNYDSNHSQQLHLEGETTSANYLLTQPQSSKIAINLQSFRPIDWSDVSFDILFTVYKKSNSSTGCPNKNWFDCGDNICVPSSLVCDNNRNCPNGNDEMVFYRCYSPLFWSIAASISLALLLIVLMIFVIVLVKRTRRHKLTKLNSLSNNQLAANDDLLVHEHDNSSKLDLTQTEQLAGRGAANNSYLASNMYLSGFENPVWTNGTLTKHQAATGPTQQFR